MNERKKVIYYIICIVAIVIISIVSYRAYIHKKYFSIEIVQQQYVDEEFTYNSNNYGFVDDNYYELYRYREIIHISRDGLISPFSIEGELVFNHEGQLFLRDLDKIYEVTDSSVDYLFEADSLRYAQRVDDRIYYVIYKYNETNSNGYYELLEYDINNRNQKTISKVRVNGFSNTFDDGYEFLIEDDWLVFADARDKSAGIGLFNMKTGQIDSVFKFDSDTYSRSLVEDIKLIDGNIYFKIYEYSDFPSYGVDDISVNSDGYDYCYVIESGKTFRGKLDERIVVSETLNLKEKYQLDYIVDLTYEEVDELFGYIEDPILIEPSDGPLELEEYDTESFSFEVKSNDIDIYYSFNQPNVMKFGQLYTAPFLIPVPNKITTIYYFSVDKNTGKTSRFMEHDYYYN